MAAAYTFYERLAPYRSSFDSANLDELSSRLEPFVLTPRSLRLHDHKMFTPPPSPLPGVGTSCVEGTLPPDPKPQPHVIKRRAAVRTKWTILLVPLVLIIITLSTRHIAHPAFFDALSGLPDNCRSERQWSGWGLHKRHPDPQTDGQSTVAFPSSVSSSLPASSTSPPTPTSPNVPTIPSNPVLPTPFPQPFDTTLSSNFSTESCLNFYTNMTESAPFRQCRSFGLLLQSSSEFLQAQGNFSLLNDMVWGTCNTVLEFSQCIANMNWFAKSLNSECAAELGSGNVLVSETLTGLLVYSLMRNVGCQSNPSTNVYCYISAAMNTNPSDLYFYQLPFGISLPNNTTPSCSACTKTIMDLYLSAVSGTDPNTTDATVRASLSKTYASASQLSVNVCGNNYVQTTAAVNGGKHLVNYGFGWTIAVVVIIGCAL